MNAKDNRSSGAMQCIVDFSTARSLRSEAQLFALRHGPNAYSDFLLKYGCRPSTKQAAVIGRLIGHRVKAADGTLQPRATKAERDVSQVARSCWQGRRRKIEHLARLRAALAYLADNEDDPATVVGESNFLCEPDLFEKLEKSIIWLNRFAEEWIKHGQRSD